VQVFSEMAPQKAEGKYQNRKSHQGECGTRHIPLKGLAIQLVEADPTHEQNPH